MLTQVTEGVFTHQSALLQNNAAVVQGKSGVLLVDPGLTTKEMADLAKDIRELGQPVVAGFSTHPDWDHVLWSVEFGEVPRYATARGAAFMKEFLAKPDWKKEVTEGLPPEIAGEVSLELFGLTTSLPAGTKNIPWDGPEARTIEHNAHAQGHAALFIKERGVLIAGDMLSDVFIPMLNLEAADPIGDYLAALRSFDEVAGDVTAVIPGHGSIGDAAEFRARIARDRAYVVALRDGKDVDDLRVTSPKEGWEWTADMHGWQAQQIAQKNKANR